MAIAFVAAADLGDNGGTTNSLTVSYTVGSGYNRLLVVVLNGDASVQSGNGGHDDITGITYASVSLTFATKIIINSGTTDPRYNYIYFLLNPASGANNVVISCTNAHWLLPVAADYTGVARSGQPDATATATAPGAATITASITTVAANCWAVLGQSESNATQAPTAGAGATFRKSGAAHFQPGMFDSNAALTVGAHSMTVNDAGTNYLSATVASFTPAAEWGIDPEVLSPRRLRRGRSMSIGSDEPIWPRTVVATPTALGWFEQPVFARRKRYLSPQTNDALPLPTASPIIAFGWDTQPPALPVRRSIRRSDSTEPIWPITVVTTPGQFGWEIYDKSPVHPLFRGRALDEVFVSFTAPATTPAIMGFDASPSLPQRKRRQVLPYEQDTPIPAAAASTPTQFSLDDWIQTTPLRRWRQLSALGREEFIGLPPGAGAAARVIRATIVRVGRLLGRQS